MHPERKWSTFGSHSVENSVDLERTQKTFAKLILKDEYENYTKALLKLNLDTQADRRENMSLKFAKNGLKFNTLADLITKKEKIHTMKMRKKLNVWCKF